MILTGAITENKEQFIGKVVLICDKLGINPDWLMAVMMKESGINHRAVNPNGGATGLIQFMPDTAIKLGTTTADLLQMSNVEQLDYVYKYLRPYRFKYRSYTDVYLAVFFPRAIGKSDDYVLEAGKLTAKKIADANEALDKNKDDKLTKAEVEYWATLGFIPEIQKILKKKI